MQAFGYCRVSTGRQAEEGESLGVQERRVRGYAMQQGFDLTSVYVERGVSGSKPLGDRPEGAKLMAVLQPGDIVVTPKLDRMFRSALDALDVMGSMRDRDVALHMIDLGGDVTGNGIAKLVFTILAAVAEAERDKVRERVTEIKRDQRGRGRYLGGALPFGFTSTDDGALVGDAGQQAAIRDAVALRAGGASLRSVSVRLKAAGHDLSHAAWARVLREAAR
ncbi:recombinase family protein [Methylobacterium sp. WL122]|nr:recombinase family protein [Methylobacterium sp. WL122]